MSLATKRWLLLTGAAALAASAAAAIIHRSTGDRLLTPADPHQSRPSLGAASFDGYEVARREHAGSSDLADAATDAAAPVQTVGTVMAQWRNGILFKDTDAVLADDALFRQEPARFLEALMTLAETDDDERVRAFSTRVLGKLVEPACAPLLTRLLDDRSQYVRMNAAWALGELAVTPAGHSAAAPALRSLRRLEEREPAKDTRAAAALAARRLM
jgi:hypothetical protein